MQVLSTKALVAVLMAIGVQQALALPADMLDEELVGRSEPGDDAANPLLKPFDCTDEDSKFNGIQELFDADCYAHLCQDVSVIMNRWDGSKENRSVDKGNGVKSNHIFQGSENLKKFDTKTPGSEYSSPEEWPPASAHQGGADAILIPVTQDAQGRQATLLSNKFYGKKPTVAQQKGDGSSKGSWFRIDNWNGAKGPYCAELNEQLKKYTDNFDSNGVIKKKPDICTEAIKDLNGLKYDVGEYAYKLKDKNAKKDSDKYEFVGKKTSKTSLQ